MKLAFIVKSAAFFKTNIYATESRARIGRIVEESWKNRARIEL